MMDVMDEQLISLRNKLNLDGSIGFTRIEKKKLGERKIRSSIETPPLHTYLAMRSLNENCCSILQSNFTRGTISD